MPPSWITVWRRLCPGNKAPEKKTVRSKQETHDHIPSTALDVEARLEQLRSLKEAGLMDKAEYEQRKQKLFKGQ